jgi:hypothetical protein
MGEKDVFGACVRGTQVHAHANIINSLIRTSALQLFNIPGCRAYGESSGIKSSYKQVTFQLIFTCSHILLEITVVIATISRSHHM